MSFLKTVLRGVCSVAVLLTLSAGAQAFIISAHAPSIFQTDTAAMDAALGLTGATIEDFEDATIATGLTVSYEVLNEGGHSFNNNPWDGVQNIRVVGGDFGCCNSNVLLSFASGMATVGIGISDLQQVWEMHVNGVVMVGDLLSITNMVGGSIRNGYLVIEAEAGEQIDSVFIRNVPNLSDSIYLDHIAFQASSSESVFAPAAQHCCWLALAQLGYVGAGRRKPKVYRARPNRVFPHQTLYPTSSDP